MITYLTNTFKPSSASNNTAYILGIPAVNRSVWRSLYASVNTSKSNTSKIKKDIWRWDLFKFENLLPVVYDSFTKHYYLDAVDSFYPFWVSNFSDNTGTNIFSQASTGFSVGQVNMPQYSSQKYSGSFDYSPVVTIASSNSAYYKGVPEVLAAERVLYAACIVPLYPIMLATSVESHLSYGPVFLSNITISVDGRNTLKPVNFSCTFDGGKFLVKPFLNKTQPNVYTFVPAIDEDTQHPTTDQEPDLNYLPYRFCNIIDCLIDYKAHPTVDSLYKTSKNRYNTQSGPSYKLVRMELSIINNINFTFTNPTDISGNYLGDHVGPKYAYLAKREVSGSFTFFCEEEILEINNSGSLSMYFGGSFFFPMDNIEWQQPSHEITAEGGYYHTFKFIARIANNAVINPGLSGLTSDSRISEFAVPFKDVK